MRRGFIGCCLLGLALAGCDGGGLPGGWRATPNTGGPQVVWDLEAESLPEIPLPNDIATWPDPSSPTGRRINASLIAPSGMERRLRQSFDRLDGWGTFAPLTVQFDAPLDTDDLLERQGRGRFASADWQRHAIYLIDLTTGVPVPLDVNSRLFPRAAANPDAYYDADPHEGESNLIFETRDEDLDRDGVLDPGEDTDFDGHLDRPNTIDGRLDGARYETIDEMLWFYERETNTLILRPILPMEENREYAVVLTNRLVGEDGRAVRSPFDTVHHLSQRDELENLPDLFAARPDLYGSLASQGWSGVSFAWTFTTQSVTRDLTALRDGLYGRGPFAYLADDFPPELVLSPVRGGTRTNRCDPGPRIYTVTPAELGEAIDGLPIAGLGFPISQLDAVLETLEDSVSHFAYGFFESPYLLGDPDAESVDDTWNVDAATGEADVDRDLVPMFIVVPKETAAHQQPFPTTLYAHGYGSLNIEAIAFAGLVARHGVATVAINAQGHGIPLGDDLLSLLDAVLGENCLAPLGRALAMHRARDLNNDDAADSAGLFFSAYMFHTRDTLRQSTLDWLQATRILRSWWGHPDVPNREWVGSEIETGTRAGPITFEGDVDGDGDVDLAGDFDGDGVPDLGGWDTEYRQWGSSLGGIISMLNVGVEPSIVAAAPVSGGGGLFDIGMRTSLGTARHPIWLRVLGPILASQPSGGPDTDTACAEGDRSVFWRLADLNEDTTTEAGCIAERQLDDGDAVVLRNRRNGEIACAGVGPEGRFRITVPTDVGDPLELTVLDAARDRMDYATCEYTGAGEPVVNDTFDTWRSGNGAGVNACANCASYQGETFEQGSRFTAPAEGLGLQRQSPDLRRLAGLAQIALEPGDPINYARNVFLRPVTAVDVPDGRTRSVMVMNTAGDTTVPPATGNAYARAAGILAFMPPDAPDDFADWRAPARFASTYGWSTPDDVLVEFHVLEGLADLERHPAPGAPRFLFDVDDLSAGQQFFAPGGNRQVPPEEGGVQPNRLSTPLRWGRESRPAMLAPSLDPWNLEGAFGVSTVLNAMTVPHGQHVILPVDPDKLFDDGEYLLNVIGWYLASGGTELPWVVLDDPFCLEDSSCRRE